MKTDTWDDYLNQDIGGRIKFFGDNDAYLFTKEVEESFRGVLSKNYIRDDTDGMIGFVTASVDGRCWHDTMWTRDTGAFLREMVQYGYFNHACLTVERLMDLVEKNDLGYYTFPEYFRYGVRGSGSEVDGTAAIVIGMILLWKRLQEGNRTKEKIREFLTCDASPVNYFVDTLKQRPLIPGSGEFGGGCSIEGEYANSVQNGLVRIALAAAACFYEKIGLSRFGESARETAHSLEQVMMDHLIAADGRWIWCVDADTLLPIESILNHDLVKGTSTTNAILSVSADVLGFELFPARWPIIDAGGKSFESLMGDPFRREQFEKYGVYAGADHHVINMVTGPSYGHGYGTQAMLLLERMDMVGPAMSYLANATYCPPEGLVLHRDSPYYFYERYYSPDLIGKVKFKEGCGALNLVCVAEPLKIARLIAGIDDTQDDVVKIIPRIPPSWTGYTLDHWPVCTHSGLALCDIEYDRAGDKESLKLKVKNGVMLPRAEVRLKSGKVTYFNAEELCIN